VLIATRANNAHAGGRAKNRVAEALAWKDTSMTMINDLWNSNDEPRWRTALDIYWRYVKPTHMAVEKEFDTLNSDTVKQMNAEQWYEFLLKKYFFWKYTAPNRYATTTSQLKKYITTSNGLDDLYKIKQRVFFLDKTDIASGLKLVCSIRGLGTAGGSGLLAVLFPTYFATVDQFAVKALSEVYNLPEKSFIITMNPDQLKLKDGVILIGIIKAKAKELNDKFKTSFWTPRRIDMILWSANR
jgi:hypothetical protein